MIFPPVRVIQDRSRYLAQNGPFGVHITTGVNDFAAVVMQEIYEGRRYMAWYWLPAIVFAVVTVLTRPELALLAVAWMLAVGRNWLPIGLDRRELMGQAIELAAIRLFYPPRDMDLEYRLQARSLLVTTNSYKRKGMFKELAAIDPSEVRPGETNPAIDLMIEWLKTLDSEATAWLYSNRKTFARYYLMERSL